MRLLPFVAIHLGCLAVWWVGVSATALIVAAALYALRMFAITAFYHRYFSHNAFRTGRAAQFAFALLGASAAQRGPLWWASHHRHHHVHADEHARQPLGAAPRLAVEPRRLVHVARATSRRAARSSASLARYPGAALPRPLGCAGARLLLCALLYAARRLARSARARASAPAARSSSCGASASRRWCCTTPPSASTRSRIASARAATTRATHRATTPGWRCSPSARAGTTTTTTTRSSARQGFYWWEIDLTYYGLRLLRALGIVWDLREVPAPARDARTRADGRAMKIAIIGTGIAGNVAAHRLHRAPRHHACTKPPATSAATRTRTASRSTARCSTSTPASSSSTTAPIRTSRGCSASSA